MILVGIIRVFREMRSGRYDEAELEQQLNTRGLMNRVLRPASRRRSPSRGRCTRSASCSGSASTRRPRSALLFLAAGAAGAGLPFYAILCLPILFAAGMSLLDTIDGSFMNFAYGWAFSQAGAQGLLQHHHHRPLGGGRARHRDDRAGRHRSPST